MTPRWLELLMRRLVPTDRIEDVLGDLEELRNRHQARRGRVLGSVLAGVETVQLAVALLVHRRRASSRTTQRTWSGIGISVLDLKLGLRMLSRYPGLTLVGGLAMAFAIAVGALGFDAITTLMRPSLPFEGGDRVVSVRNWDTEESKVAVPRLDIAHSRRMCAQNLQPQFTPQARISRRGAAFGSSNAARRAAIRHATPAMPRNAVAVRTARLIPRPSRW